MDGDQTAVQTAVQTFMQTDDFKGATGWLNKYVGMWMLATSFVMAGEVAFAEQNIPLPPAVGMQGEALRNRRGAEGPSPERQKAPGTRPGGGIAHVTLASARTR